MNTWKIGIDCWIRLSHPFYHSLAVWQDAMSWPCALPNGEEGFVQSRLVFKKRFLAHVLSLEKSKRQHPNYPKSKNTDVVSMLGLFVT